MLLLILSFLLAVMEATGVGAVLPFVSLLSDAGSIQGTPIWAFLVRLFGPRTPESMAILVGAGVLVIFVVKNLLSMVQLSFLFHYSQNVFRTISTRLLRSYMAHPFTFFLQSNTAILAKNVVTETKLVSEQIVEPFFYMTAEALVLVSVLAALAIYDPGLFLILTLGLAVVLGSIYLMTTRQSRRYGDARERTLSGMSKVALEALSGIREIKVSGTQRYFTEAYDRFAREHAGANARILALLQVPRLSLETLLVCGVVGLMLLLKVRGAVETETIGLLAMYLAAAYRLLPSVNRIISSLMRMRYIQAGFDSFGPALEAALERGWDRKEPAPALPLPFRSELRLQEVHFRYPDSDHDVVRGIDLTVRKGEVVGFVGESGAGKSTLISLLLGLLKPDRGTMTVDGNAVGPDQLPAWQANLAYVPQQIFMADDTLAANVALGQPPEEQDRERILWALQVAQLSDLLAELPEGVETRVGDRGARLSGGQIQRIGIARALYRQTPVLVLDEATSALDSETEDRVVRGLREQSGGRTVLVIAHRHTTLRHCDRIYRLEQGRIVGTLTYQELQATAGGAP